MKSFSRIIAPVAMAASILGTVDASAQDRPQPRDHAHHWMERLMATYDLDGDGKVKLDAISADQERLFAAIDTNGDGSLSPDEFRRRGHVLELFSTTSLFDLLDANSDGKLSADEIGGPSRRWFARYDANKDGAIEAPELPDRPGHWRVRRLRGEEGRERPPSRSEHFFRTYDADSDGRVTAKEIGDVQRKLFGALDANGDGSVTAEEFRAGPRAREIFAAASIFDLLDADRGGDGKLSLAEIQSPTKRWFLRYDANGDGAMTADELPERHRGRAEGKRR
jgi:Ca2+-binding EF-hand superfamily protein